ncbi:MAG: toxin [Desulfobacterales bacterium]|nr:toxin [Desulfobacterales bacterium]
MEAVNVYLPTDTFSHKLERIKRSDPPGFKRIRKVIERLLVKPQDADGKMHGIYQGRLKKYVGRRDYRVIYNWCRLCRKENRRMQQDCDNCETIPDNSVIFFDLYHKNDKKKFKKNT